MKFSRIVFLARQVVVSGGLVSSVTAECGPPQEEAITTTRAAMFGEADTDKSNTLSVGGFCPLYQVVRGGTDTATLYLS